MRESEIKSVRDTEREGERERERWCEILRLCEREIHRKRERL